MFFTSNWITYSYNMLHCWFEAFLGKFSENLHFLLTKISSEILRIFFFSTSLKMGKSRGKFGLVVNNPFSTKQLNGRYINNNCFSPNNKPHTTKLCFPVVLKHLRANSLKTSLFSPKKWYLRKEPKNTQKVCYS